MRSKVSIHSHPLHPILVSLPIGLWVAAFVFELVGRNSPDLWAAAFYCVIGGCVGAALAALPGFVDWLTVVPPNSSARQRGLLHGGLNALNLLLFIYIAYRLGSPDARPDGATLLWMAVGIVVLGIAGWLGGTLVYRNQIGIDHRYANAGTFKSRTLKDWSKPVCHQSELGDGQMLLAIVGHERVAVGRPGRVFRLQRSLYAYGWTALRRRAGRVRRAMPLARLGVRYPHGARGGRAGAGKDRHVHGSGPER
jgi:uncharacterized membrane protein